MPPARSILTYAGRDGHLYALPLGGGPLRRLTRELEGRGLACSWPAWSPDGQRLAFAAHSGAHRSGEAESSLWVVEQDASKPRQLYQREGERPIYFGWSPDGKRIALLSNESQGIALVSVAAGDPPKASAVLRGQPFYFAWSPDSTELLVHVGGSARLNPQAFLGRIRADGGAGRGVQEHPAEFRAPSFSADGSWWAAAVGEGAEDAIAAWNAAGERTVVRRYQGKAAFAWSPSGARLGYAISHDTRSPGYSEGLCVAEVGGQERLIATGQVMAFFWSPLGQQVAYLTANPARDRLDLLVAQADGSGRRQVASLVPSEDFMFFLSFFDQFAPAASLWSPDGRTLAFAGKALREHGNGKGAGDQNHVYVVAADGSSQPEEAAPGSIGVFAP